MTRSRDVADTQDNLGGAVAPFVAGKNKIINGDFGINQRNFSSSTSGSVYTFDRWLKDNGGNDGTTTTSAQTFTVGTAPVAGYESINFLRSVVTGQTATNCYSQISQKIEDVRTFAGQTITLSFWGKAASGTPKIAVEIRQNFGTGGSPSSVAQAAGGSVTLSTSWARYSLTMNIPSISGKTLGTTAGTSFLQLLFWLSAGSDYNSLTNSLGIQNATIDIWGIQAEAGSVATPFTTASGSIGGELALCQRYYYRVGGSSAYERLSTMASGASSTTLTATFASPVTMRVAPTIVDYSTLTFWDGSAGLNPITNVVIAWAGRNMTEFTVTASAGGITTYRPYFVIANGSTNAYLALSAEL